MPEYKNTTEGFAMLRKKIITKAGPIILLSYIAGLTICYSTNNINTTIPVWVFIIVFTLLIVVFAMMRGINQQKKNYYSYRLQLNTDNLSRQQNGLPPITIPFNNITQITESKQGGFLIKGQNAADVIAISPYIESYQTVKASLQAVQPIQQLESKNLLQKYPFVLPLITIGLMATVYISVNKIIVALSGLVLIAFMMWAFFKMRTSPQLDARVKRSSWFIFIVLIAIIAIMYNKIF